jgi:hypothetical protein
MTPQELQAELANFCGSTNLYHRSSPILVHYTEGIKYLQEATNCHWLIDVIASYQTQEFKAEHDRQVWKLKVLPGSSAIVTCDDGNGNICVAQGIKYTDFPLPKFDIWVEIQAEGRIFLFLPSEY